MIVNSGGDYFPINMGQISKVQDRSKGGGDNHIVNINFNGANQQITQNFISAALPDTNLPSYNTSDQQQARS